MPSNPNENPFDTDEPPNLLPSLMMRRLPSTQEKPSTTPTLSPVEVAPLLFSVIAAALLLAPAGSNLDRPQTIGLMASVLAFAVFVPQAVRVWRARNDHHALLGVSVTTNMFIINNSIVWGLYAASIQEFFVGAAGIINLPLAGLIVAVVVRSRWIQQRTDT